MKQDWAGSMILIVLILMVGGYFMLELLISAGVL